MRPIILQSTPSDFARRVATFRNRNPQESLLDRAEEDARAAAGLEASAICFDEKQDEIVGLVGAYGVTEGLFEISNPRISLTGYNLRVPLMQVLALHTHFTHERYTAPVIAVLTTDLRAIRNVEIAGFSRYISPPETYADRRRRKAAGRPFRIYRATLFDLQRMANNLLALYADPILHAPGQGPIRLELRHPLFETFLNQMQRLVASPLEANRDGH